MDENTTDTNTETPQTTETAEFHPENIYPNPVEHSSDSSQLHINSAPKHTKSWVLLGPVLILYAGIVFVLTMLGSSSEEYFYVQKLSDVSLMLAWVMAFLCGIVLAKASYNKNSYRLTDGDVQMRPSYMPLLCTLLCIAGLFLGVIPGVILFIIFTTTGSFKQKMIVASEEDPATFKTKRLALITISAILAFISGFIGAFIYAIIVAYPLSKRACELSGSKYC